MGIKIIDEPDDFLTRAEHDELIAQYIHILQKAWDGGCPISFEDWVRGEKTQKPITNIVKTESPRMAEKGLFGWTGRFRKG